MGNLQQMMQQAKQLNEKMVELKKELESREEVATAGGGMVEVKIRGNMEVASIRIDPEIVREGDVAMLEDLVTSAINEALRKMQQVVSQSMSELTGGLPIPGLGV